MMINPVSPLCDPYGCQIKRLIRCFQHITSEFKSSQWPLIAYRKISKFYNLVSILQTPKLKSAENRL